MSDNNESEEKKASYPYVPLASALAIGDVVKSLSGKGTTSVSKSLLASSLKEDEKSQTLNFKIASAKNFGIIQGRSNYTLTEIAKQYYWPTRPTHRREALVTFLETPKAFKAISDRFDGSTLPERHMLGNILHREAGVPESWKDRVSGCFILSAKTAAVIDAGGHLRIKASRDLAVAQTPEPTETASITSEISGTVQETGGSLVDETQDPEVKRHKRVFGKLNVSPINFTTTEPDESTGVNKVVYVEIPRDLSLSAWQLLNLWVQSKKPKKQN